MTWKNIRDGSLVPAPRGGGALMSLMNYATLGGSQQGQKTK